MRINPRTRTQQAMKLVAFVLACILPILDLYKIQNDIRFHLGDDAAHTMFDGYASGTNIGFYNGASTILTFGTACLVAIIATLIAHSDLSAIASILAVTLYWFVLTCALGLLAIGFAVPVTLASIGATVFYFGYSPASDSVTRP